MRLVHKAVGLGFNNAGNYFSLAFNKPVNQHQCVLTEKAARLKIGASLVYR
ncbi:MAG: hypothetical protein ACREDX_00050 [Aestuariivirga sp.]